MGGVGHSSKPFSLATLYKPGCAARLKDGLPGGHDENVCFAANVGFTTQDNKRASQLLKLCL
jgi:hypothetical protein